MPSTTADHLNDLPTTGTSGFLTITPSVTIISIKNEGGKLVITYQ
jgi:hypothetical protein